MHQLRHFVLRSIPIKSTILLSTIIFLFSNQLHAQEVMMAKGNKNMTLTYGASNIYRVLLRAINNDYSENKTYDIKCSNPLQFALEYAISDYTTIGLSGSYYSFHLQEIRVDSPAYFVDSKGSKMAFQLRGVRYMVQRPKSSFYFFGGIGMRLRNMTTSATADKYVNASELFTLSEINLKSYMPLSVEFGMGLKFLASKRIGICCEYGAITGLGRFGLFYLMKNKWRRSKDNIGW